MAQRQRIKWYEDCRLEVTWWTNAEDGALPDGSFESATGAEGKA